MRNFSVDHRDTLLKELKREGVEVLDTVEDCDNPKFTHIKDVGGICVELWEARDTAHDKIISRNTNKSYADN